jgi:hypothetical protein
MGRRGFKKYLVAGFVATILFLLYLAVAGGEESE